MNDEGFAAWRRAVPLRVIGLCEQETLKIDDENGIFVEKKRKLEICVCAR